MPAFALWELAVLLKIGRIALKESYAEWAEHLVAHPGFELADCGVEVITEAYSYPFPDPFDGVITATAKVMDLPLITKDMAIDQSRLVEVYW